jgi:hypothetical protein
VPRAGSYKHFQLSLPRFRFQITEFLGMRVYIKNKKEQKWHWVFDCPEYPEGDKIEKIYKKPHEDELCLICRQIEAAGRARSGIKEIIDDENLH